MNERPRDTEAPEAPEGMHRRTVVRAAAWAVPAIAISTASPAMAASTPLPTVLTVSFDKPVYTVEPNSTLAEGTISLLVMNQNGPVANATVTVTLTTDLAGAAPGGGLVVDPGTGGTPVGDPSAQFSGGLVYVGVTDATGKLTLPDITTGKWSGSVVLTATTVVGNTNATATPSILRITRDYALMSWGYNYLGILGANSAAGDSTVPLGVALPETLTDFTIGNSAGVTQFALDPNTGEAWGWGYGVPGLPGSLGSNPLPLSVGKFPGAIDVVSAYYSHFILMEDGSVLSFGYSAWQLLGDNVSYPTAYKRTPSPVLFPADAGKIVKVVASTYNAYALDENGAVWGWGVGDYNARGDGKGSLTSALPTRVLLPAGRAAIDLSSHLYGGHVILDDNTVANWGCGLYDMLAVTSVASREKVLVVPGVSGAQKIFSGWYNTAIILGDGSMRTWGTSDYAANGQGVDFGYPVGVFDNGLTNVKKVVFNTHSGLALKNNGTVWHWGYNGSGENGNGTRSTIVLRPVQVDALHNIRDIGTSQYSYFAAQQR